MYAVRDDGCEICWSHGGDATGAVAAGDTDYSGGQGRRGSRRAAVRFGPVWRSCCGFKRLLCTAWARSWGSALRGVLRPWRPRVRGASGVLHVPASAFPGQDASCPGSADDRAAGRAARCHGATVPRCCGSWDGRTARCRNARREWTIGWSCRAVQRRPSVSGPTSLWMFSTASRSGARLGWPRSSGPGCGRVSRRRARSPWWCAGLTGRPFDRPGPARAVAHLAPLRGLDPSQGPHVVELDSPRSRSTCPLRSTPHFMTRWPTADRVSASPALERPARMRALGGRPLHATTGRDRRSGRQPGRARKTASPHPHERHGRMIWQADGLRISGGEAES